MPSSLIHMASQLPALPTWHSITPSQSPPCSLCARWRRRNVSFAVSVSSATSRMTSFKSEKSACLRFSRLMSRWNALVYSIYSTVRFPAIRTFHRRS